MTTHPSYTPSKGALDSLEKRRVSLPQITLQTICTSTPTHCSRLSAHSYPDYAPENTLRALLGPLLSARKERPATKQSP